MDVIVRGLDRTVYRRVKAKAALMGYKVSVVVQEAMKRWLEESEKIVETEYDANNAAYEMMKASLDERYRGMYVAFHSGKFLGAAESLKEAGELARERGAKRVVIVKVGSEEPAGGEWLWSSIELLTA